MARPMPVGAPSMASCGSTWLRSSTTVVPMLIQPISTSSWMAEASRPAAMKMSAIPVHRKNVRRLIRAAPRYMPAPIAAAIPSR